MKPILTMDFETDPFEHGLRVKPFACGLYDGKNFGHSWSPKCAASMMKYLDSFEESIIYMHNGGRFDVFFLLKYLEADMHIINGRIVRAHLGKHEFRDSYSILPIPLRVYKKDDIDINKLRKENREKNKPEILNYLQGDCVYLHELVTGFRDEFGDYLTIGSAAMAQMKKFHPFEQVTKYLDEKFRTNFFFGGRVQCFRKAGIYHQPFKIYDVNSMYPYVMKNFKHPNGREFSLEREITQKTAFIVAEGINKGAFPLRTKRGIDFTQERGIYHFSIHEWQAAEQTNTFKLIKVIKTFNFDKWIVFDDFVDHFYNLRQAAEKRGDKMHKTFYKLILNSAYGKFAQNPDNFFDYAITHGQTLDTTNGWSEHFIHNDGEYVIWRKPVQRHSYYNVSIGASITSAARSVLLSAMAKSRDTIYCDTDSIICRSLDGVEFSDTQLGAWKLEGIGDRFSLAGKKLYACYNGDECIKQANKGAHLTPQEIDDVASGKVVMFKKDAPTFKLDGRVNFISRNIRATV